VRRSPKIIPAALALAVEHPPCQRCRRVGTVAGDAPAVAETGLLGPTRRLIET